MALRTSRESCKFFVAVLELIQLGCEFLVAFFELRR